MIVLEMLRPHPLVHCVPVSVNVMAGGKVIPAAWSEDVVSWGEVVHTMEVPFLVYGEEEVPDQPWSFQLPDIGLLLPEPRHVWPFPDEHGPGETVMKVDAGFFFIRRDIDVYGPLREELYHLFFVEAPADGSVPPFWLEPPIARLRPWQEVVDDAVWEAGLRMEYVKPVPLTQGE